MGFHHVVQAGLELLTSSNLRTAGSQNAEIKGLSHHPWRCLCFPLSVLFCIHPVLLPHAQVIIPPQPLEYLGLKRCPTMPEMRSPCVAQGGLELLGSSNPPALASQNTGITGALLWAFPSWEHIRLLGIHHQPVRQPCMKL
ncbi:Protein GVQW1 [Plecturocebus cupreus]